MSEELIRSLARMDVARFRRYRDDLAFYKGSQWVDEPRRRERRLVLNYTKTVIEKVAAYTLTGLQSLVDSDGVEKSASAQRDEALLQQVYDDNNMGALEFDSEVDASVLGDGAFKVTWQFPGSDVGAGRVRITAPDVQGLYAWTERDGDVWRVAQRYGLDAEAFARFMGKAAPAAAVSAVSLEGERRTGPAVSTPRPGTHRVVELWTEELFEVYVDGKLHEAKANPYGFIPYVIYQNVRVPKQFWGESDVAAVRVAQRELNRAMTQLSRILELSGNPIAVLENVNEGTDIAVTPGAVWELPPDSKAYLLDLLAHGGVEMHTKFIELVYRAVHDLGETPRVSFGEADAAVSGVALNLQMDPLVKKLQRKRMIRAAAIRQRNMLVLRLLQQYASEKPTTVVTRVVFGDVLPADRARLVDDETKLIAAGVHSRATAAGAVGVADPQAEFDGWEAEQRRVAAVTPRPQQPAPAPRLVEGLAS